MKKAVIFDMDGTLWDSVDEIVESWNKTCPEMHIRREQLIGLMGKTMDCFAKELLSEYKLDEAMDIIHACERDENEYLSHVGANCTEISVKCLKLCVIWDMRSVLSATVRQDTLKYFWSIIILVIWWQTSSVMAIRNSRKMQI